MKNKFSLLLVALFFFGAYHAYSQIQVLTGTEKGTYYKQAEDMNKILPTKTKMVGTDSTQVSFLDIRKTAGSSFNFDYITDKNHEAKVAIMQMDVLYLKQMEDMINETNLTDDLLVLMYLNMEEIHLITKETTNIHSLSDLTGRTVGIGTSNEGTYTTARYIQNKTKISWNSKNLNSMDAMKALLLDKVDAFFVVGTAPLDILNIIPAASPMKMEMVALDNVEALDNTFLPITMEANTYPWLTASVNTYGVASAVVINKSKLNEEELADLKLWRAAVIGNLETLKATGHSSWKTSTPGEPGRGPWPVLE